MGDDISKPLSKENDNSIKIQNNGLIEFYVIGLNFSWCYIVTHEPDGCGPYFIINKNKSWIKLFRIYYILTKVKLLTISAWETSILRLCLP